MDQWPSAQDLLDLHHVVVRLFDESGDPIRFVGERAPGLADAAVNRPLAEFGGRILYKTHRAKTAALVHSINSSHVFHDGNKRTSVAALVVLLDSYDWNLDATDEELSQLMIDVSSRNPPFEGDADSAIGALTSWIGAHTTKKQYETGDLDVIEFLERCEAVGGAWRAAGNSYILLGTSANVRISRSTRSLSPGVVKSYLSRVGLTEAYTGVSRDQFAEGRVRETTLVRQYQTALELLAAHDRSDD